MKINKWPYDIKDLQDYPSFIISDSLSVLANSVTAANYDFLKTMRSGSEVLEIGCGVTSYIKDNIKSSSWFGVDVFEFNEGGIPSIATDIASVEYLPYEDNKFDYVVSNQSIEHWEEYRVKTEDAIDEIFRTLKVGGSVILNFPLQLHGQKEFVKPDLEYIDSLFSKSSREVIRKTAFIDSTQPDYKGWRRCSIPDFYVKKSLHYEETSYVVEYEVKKVDLELLNFSQKVTPILKRRRSLFSRSLDYGISVFIWKICRKVKIKSLTFLKTLKIF